MAFIEKQRKGNKKYFYLTKTIRANNSFKKIRVLLSNKPISGYKLRKLAKEKEQELNNKSHHARKSLVFFSYDSAGKVPLKDRLFIWERPCRLYLVHISAEAASPQEKIFGRGWGKTYCFFRNNMIKAVWEKKHMIKSGIFILNNLMSQEYFNKKLKQWDRLNNKLNYQYEKLDNISLKSVPDKKLIEAFKEFHMAFLDWWDFAQVAELISISAEYLLRNVIPNKLFPIVTSPSKKSYTAIEEEELLKIALNIKSDKKASKLFLKDNHAIMKNLGKFKEIKELLEGHARKYYWQQNGYFETEVLTLDHFINQANDLIKKDIDLIKLMANNEDRLKEIREEKAQIISSLLLEDNNKKLIELADFFCAFQDERKAISLKGHHYLSVFLQEISRRTGISRNLLYWCTPYEVSDIIRGKFNINELKKRQRHMTLIFGAGGMNILTGNESMKKEKEILGRGYGLNISEFEGTRAQGGKVVGKVIKVLDPRKCGNFKSGCILVTTMTSPDFMPLMKIAAAIITDEGGITSHASIVARELGVPCVIGTRIATEVLNNNDLVEVNANHGIVKIIKRCQNNS